MKRILTLACIVILVPVTLAGCMGKWQDFFGQFIDTRREVTEDEVFRDVNVVLEGVYPIIEVNVNYSHTNRITEHVKLSIDKVDWENKTVMVYAEMDEEMEKALKVFLKPMQKEFKLSGFPSYYIDWEILSTEEKQILSDAGKKILNKRMAEFINNSSSDVFGDSWTNSKVEERGFQDITLDNVSFMQIRKGAKPSQYGAALFSVNSKLYNRLILTYSVTMFGSNHKNGIVRYIPVIANNLRLLEDGNINYDLGEIPILDKYFRDNPYEHKAIFMDEFQSAYEIFNFRADDFLKEIDKKD